ncbi:hypothetical protein FDUTEX481_06365 [Tolypothrix sp. PCC 7601]|nr:hypothetical protein FDUTEX481_06365 [Tolypothrix sp. PCC 7601]
MTLWQKYRSNHSVIGRIFVYSLVFSSNAKILVSRSAAPRISI